MSGTTSGLVRRFHGAVIEQLPDVPRERMVYLSDHRAELAGLLVKVFEPELETYSITVDYTMTVEEMNAAGEYDYVNPDINTKNFGKELDPKRGQEKLSVVPFHLNREATSQEVLDEMERRGLRPATLAELLAFGARHPEIQRKFPIAALGSNCVLYGRRLVAFLWGYASRRRLRLLYLACRWFALWRFLAVRK